MGIQFVFKAPVGEFTKAADEEETRLARAVTKAMVEVAGGAKEELRRQVKEGFRPTPRRARKVGQNFEKAVQANVYPDPGKGRNPKKVSLEPAAVPHVKAGFAEVFEEGRTVHARNKFLVVPLPAAMREKTAYDRQWKSGKVQTSYRKWSDIEAAERDFGPLRLIPSKSGFVLAADAKRASDKGLKNRKRSKDFVPLFALVTKVREPRKLRFRATVAKWAGRLGAAFNQHINDK